MTPERSEQPVAGIAFVGWVLVVIVASRGEKLDQLNPVIIRPQNLFCVALQMMGSGVHEGRYKAFALLSAHTLIGQSICDMGKKNEVFEKNADPLVVVDIDEIFGV